MTTTQDQTTKLQHQLIAKFLKEAQLVAKGNVIKSSDLDRSTREKLTFAGYLSEVIRGWYLLTTPGGKGTTTLWYSNYWDFIREYLKERFGEDGYCLTAESSLDLISGQNIISNQITIVTKKPSNQTIDLLFKTSILLYQDLKNFPTVIEKVGGLNTIPLNESICKSSPTYFLNKFLNMEICLKLVGDASDLSRVLLSGQHVTAANRLMGAYSRLGDKHTAEQIEKDMQAAGFTVTPIDPFEHQRLFLVGRPKLVSPFAGRVSAMWDRMREDVLAVFPKSTDPLDSNTIRIIQELYVQDSYHSLSIEGYQVTTDLIEKINRGEWAPDSHDSDHQQRNALAALGYHGAFQSVLSSVGRVLSKKPPGKVFYEDLQNWYRELFKPVVQAGLLRPEALAGYRSQQVYISGSRHIPPPPSAVLDSMSTLEEKLNTEDSAAVRAILGHFIFVFIHPYMDGNGRIGRLTMNLMLISGGYNWTVIRASERKRYMEALETASVLGHIRPFAEFVLSEMEHWRKK